MQLTWTQLAWIQLAWIQLAWVHQLLPSVSCGP